MAADNPRAPRRKSRTAGKLINLYRRWRGAQPPLSDLLWKRALRTSSYARALPDSDQARLRRLTDRLLRTKSIEGAVGLDVTAPMRARIALHACIPVLNLGLDCYSDWSAIVVYPGDFRVHDEHEDEFGIVHREIMDLCGQSLSEGPIVLSWEAIQEEDTSPADQDLVIHECAHKLDLLAGEANGFPPLPAAMDARAWARDFNDAYQELCDRLDGGGSSRIDPYAAEDPAEFFAVISETFFTAPRLVAADYPAVYEQMKSFYRQDPRARMRQDSP